MYLEKLTGNNYSLFGTLEALNDLVSWAIEGLISEQKGFVDHNYSEEITVDKPELLDYANAYIDLAENIDEELNQEKILK